MTLTVLHPVTSYGMGSSLHDFEMTVQSSLDYRHDIGYYSSEYDIMPPYVDEESSGSHDNSSYPSTAVNKSLNLPISMEFSSDWETKDIDLWAPIDTVNWVEKVARENGLDCEGIHNFSTVDGYRLRNMSEEKFCTLEPVCGSILYRSLQSMKQEQGFVSLPLYEVPEDLPTTVSLPEFKSAVENSHDTVTREPIIDSEQPKIKRPPGRPRLSGRKNKKLEKKTGRLWEFIRDLLLKPEYCPSLICWEDHDQGIFRFVHSEKVANLWGTIKENPKMTYEKLSRAMRYYYKSKVLQPVLGRRLVYKFGPTATGWRTHNPNFKIKDKH